MAIPRIDVGVIGAGTAGAAAALFLARAGHRVRLYEAVAEPAAIGAGIMLQPSGMSVLAELGLLAPILARGARVDALRCLNHRRWKVLDLAYADVHPDAFGLGLHRGVLFDTLLTTAQGEPGLELVCGVRVETMKHEGERHRLFDAEGKLLGEHQLIVVADGARSQLRDDTKLTRRAQLYPWGALWTVLPDPEALFTRELFQVVRGTQHMLGFLPSGLGPVARAADAGPGARDTPLVSVFWSVHAERVEAWRDAGIDAWKSIVCAYEPRAESLLHHVKRSEDLLFARYHDVVLSPWHLPQGVVYLGDAAHATSPQLGQGANLALCDASTLAASLKAHDSLAEALAHYSRERRAQLAYYQWATRFLTPFFQSDLAPLGWLRDAFMGVSCKLPFVRSKMIRTMCGLERGVVFGNALPMPRLRALGPGA